MTDKNSDRANNLQAAEAAEQARQDRDRSARDAQVAQLKAYRQDLEGRVQRLTDALTKSVNELNLALPERHKLTILPLTGHDEGRFIYTGQRALAYWLTPIGQSAHQGLILATGWHDKLKLERAQSCLCLWAGTEGDWCYQRYSEQIGSSMYYCSRCQSKPGAPQWHVLSSAQKLADLQLDLLTAKQFPPTASLAPAFVPVVQNRWHDFCNQAFQREQREYRNNHPMGM